MGLLSLIRSAFISQPRPLAKPIPPSSPVCSRCGKHGRPREAFCASCGTVFSASAPTTQSASIVIVCQTPEPHHTFMSVVGESFHQDALLAVLSSNGRHVRATLVPEPNNPYDENAVKIVIDGHDVGHLSRDVARRFVSVLARQAAPIVVPAELRGGEPGKPTIGVTLNFEAVYALPRSRKPRKTKGAT